MDRRYPSFPGELIERPKLGVGRWRTGSLAKLTDTAGVEMPQTDHVAAANGGGAEEKRLRVFLSYSRRDMEFVKDLAAALERHGYLVDFDLSSHDPNNVETGISAEDEWWRRIQKMIALADAVVFCVSPDSARSPIVDEELAYTRSLSKRVIAILHRAIDFAKAPPRVSALNVKIHIPLAADPGFAPGVAQLAEALQTDVAWLREQTRLQLEALQWIESARHDDKLMRGSEIPAAEAWLMRRPVNADGVSDSLQAYFIASREAQARRDAAERAAMKRQRRLQALVGVLTFVAFLITLAGGWYVVDRQRDVSRAESLMTMRSAQTLLDQGDFPRALKLALIAARDSFLAPASSPAGAFLATAADSTQLVAEFRGHSGTVHGARLSNDKKLVWTWGEDGTIRIWDANTGKLIAAPIAAGDPVHELIFSSDERRMLAVHRNGVQLWDVASRQAVGARVLGRPGDWSRELKTSYRAGFLADPRWFFVIRSFSQTFESGAENGIFSTETAAPVYQPVYSEEWGNPEAFVRPVVALPRSVGGPIEALFWDRNAAAPSVLLPGTGVSLALKRAQADENWLGCQEAGPAYVAYRAANTVVIESVVTTSALSPVAKIAIGPGQVSFRFSPACDRLFLSQNVEWRAFDIVAHAQPIVGIAESRETTDAEEQSLPRAAATPPLGLNKEAIHGGLIGFSAAADDDFALTWGRDGTAALWSLLTDSERSIPTLPKNVSAALAPTGEAMVLWINGGGAILRNTRTGKDISLPGLTRPPGFAPAFSEDGTVFIGANAGRVELRRADDGALVQALALPDQTESIGFAPDGAYIQIIYRRPSGWSNLLGFSVATGVQTASVPIGYSNRWAISGGGRFGFLLRGSRPSNRDEAGSSSFGVYDLKSGKDLWYRRSKAYLSGFQLSKDGERVLLWGHSPSAEIWDLAGGKSAKPTTIPSSDWITFAAFTKDETAILIGGRDGSVGVWDRVSAQLNFPAIKHETAALGGEFAVLPNAQEVIVSWDAQAVRVSDARTGKPLGRDLIQAKVARIRVSPNGAKILLVGGGRARLWSLQTMTPIGAAFVANDARFVGDGRVAVASEARAGIAGSWLLPDIDNNDLIKRACASELTGEDGALGGLRRLDDFDVAAAPLLAGRESDNVCAWRRAWYDRTLQAAIGWAFK